MEHRWGERIELCLPIRFRIGAQRVQARLRDVSISGCRIDVEGVQAFQGAELDIEIPPFSALSTGSVLQGSIVRATTQGVGVEWSELSPPGLAAILNWACRPPADSRAIVAAVA